LAARVNERILCLHGGIGRLTSIAQIDAIPRPQSVRVHELGQTDITDVLWSDPPVHICVFCLAACSDSFFFKIFFFCYYFYYFISIFFFSFFLAFSYYLF
jgi:hypothetical protein